MMDRALAWTKLQLADWLPDRLFPSRPEVFSPVPETIDGSDARVARRWLFTRLGDRDATIHRFEREFAAWNGSKHAAAFAAGRVALSACIEALALGPGDEVIVPGYTCVVVPNAFEFAGVKVVYCDIELESYGPDADSLARRITPQTKAILIQHLYGLVCRDFRRILALAQERGLKVIEDCCHATGAELDGRKLGNFGDVAFYSSEQSKVFNTIQGGVAVTNDERLARRLKAYWERAERPPDWWTNVVLYNVLLAYYVRAHPKRSLLSEPAKLLYGPDPMVSVSEGEKAGKRPSGYARIMTAPIAELGRNQLGKIDQYNQTRRRWAAIWREWCERNHYAPPLVIDGSRPVFLRYPVLVEPHKKADPAWAREELGIELGVWFVTHLHPAERPVAGCPNADKAVRQCVNLPCGVSDVRSVQEFA